MTLQPRILDQKGILDQQRIELPSLTIEEVRMEHVVALMNVMGDSNPIHSDGELARSLGFRGPVNQGPANLGYVLNMVIDWIGHPAYFRRISSRFTGNTYPGDRLVARGTAKITEVGTLATIIECEFSLSSDGGETALIGSAELEVPSALARTLFASRS